MSSKEEKFYEILDSLEKSEWTLSHKSGDNVYLVKTYKVMEHKCTVTVSVNPRDPKISLNYITITPSSIKLAKAIKEVFGEYASVGRHEKRIDVVFLVKEVYSDVAELEERIEEVFEAVREEVNRTRIEVRDYAANLMKEGYLISKEDDKYKLLKIV
ncbi:MAG TPA: hypothetical protein ENF55_02450, partial [Thermoprotei archaeon]|nr:hypothetical protein [Thermoprotei archaeon]